MASLLISLAKSDTMQQNDHDADDLCPAEDVKQPKEPRRQNQPTTSTLSQTKLAQKRNTKTNVFIVTPKRDDLRALNISSTNSHYHNAFDIQRIIPGLNKAGTLYERSDHSNPKLQTLNLKEFSPNDKATSAWRLGTFVLVLKGATSESRKVRNIYHDEEVWNARSLQHIYRPWGLPSTLPYDDGGVPLKIVFPKQDMSVKKGAGRAFEAGEPLLVLTAPGEDSDVMLPVIDFEGYRGEVFQLDVFYNVVDVPWNVRVNRQWWQKQIELFDEEAQCWAKCGLIDKIVNAHNTPSPSSEASRRVLSRKSEEQLNHAAPSSRNSMDITPTHSKQAKLSPSSKNGHKRKIEVYVDSSENASPSKK